MQTVFKCAYSFQQVLKLLFLLENGWPLTCPSLAVMNSIIHSVKVGNKCQDNIISYLGSRYRQVRYIPLNKLAISVRYITANVF